MRITSLQGIGPPKPPHPRVCSLAAAKCWNTGNTQRPITGAALSRTLPTDGARAAMQQAGKLVLEGFRAKTS